MLLDTLRLIFNRDLNRLTQEIEQYIDEKNLWRVERGIANSAGNLGLHLVGNLKLYVGAELGGIAYNRNREQEFATRQVPRAELLQQLQETRQAVEQTLQRLTPEDLLKEYPVQVFETKNSVEYMLVHLASHLTYHLGQINYHRRLLDN